VDYEQKPYAPELSSFRSHEVDQLVNWGDEEERYQMNPLSEGQQKYKYDMLSAAIDITTIAKNDPNYIPTDEELELFLNAIPATTAWNRESGDINFIQKCIDEQIVEKVERKSVSLDEKILTDHENYDDSHAHVLRGHFYEYILGRLSQEQQDRMAIYMSQRLNIVYESNLYEDLNNPYVSLLLYDLKPSPEALKRVSSDVVDHVVWVVEQIKSRPQDSYGEYRYLDGLVTLDGHNKIIDGLLDHPRDEKLKVFMGQVMRTKGMVPLFNHLRKNMLSSDPELSAKSKDLLLYLMGDLKSKPEEVDPTTDATVDEFYTSVFLEPGEYALNVNSKDRRVGMVKDTLRKNGVEPGARVVELACGTGWLSAGLREDGYEVYGFDKHPDMVYMANSDYGGGYEAMDWNDWGQMGQFLDRFSKSRLDALVINGRSVRHVENPIAFFKQLSKTIKDGGVLMWDTPDVEKKGSAQNQKLEAMREFMENFGFNKEWLKKYHWRMVGAPPGQAGESQHYIDSWTPSAQLAEWFCNFCGFELVETIREENYDGEGASDNLYFVMKKVEKERLEEVAEDARRKIDTYYYEQKTIKNENLCHVHPLSTTFGSSAAF
jgi:SAM-dependent methyltransferase